MCKRAHRNEFIHKAYRHWGARVGSCYWQEYLFIATFPWHSHQKSFYILWYHWQCLYKSLISEKIQRKGNDNLHVLAFQNVGHFTGSFIKTECESCEIPSLAFGKWGSEEKSNLTSTSSDQLTHYHLLACTLALHWTSKPHLSQRTQVREVFHFFLFCFILLWSFIQLFLT